jgi:tRNA-2-methylthio-N6-dimethylallyladenosine synthase
MPHYYIWTIGCQMNKAESERLGSLFQQMGYQPAPSAREADLIVLNSCVVRQSAENRVSGMLNSLKALKKSNLSPVLAVTGCLVNSDTKQLRRRFPHVDHFFKPGDLPEWLENKPARVLLQSPGVSTFIPIIQGCDNFCSYCIVPYRRGRQRSRPVCEIVKETELLVEQGAKEVVLLGQNVDSYGYDLPGRPDLARLLYELKRIDGLARIRFLTNHPNDMSPGLIDAIAELDKVCEQINLPLQSGDNEILKAMRRSYTAEHYRLLVSRIRSRVPEIALSTDVIVGFPGEGQEQFQATVGLLQELRFDTVHVAAYSPRPGTVAAREYEDSIPSEEKKRRLAVVEQLQEKIAAEINARLLDKVVEVLVEGNKKGKWQGRSRSGKLVFFSQDDDLLGQLVPVKVERTSPWSLQGKANLVNTKRI